MDKINPPINLFIIGAIIGLQPDFVLLFILNLEENMPNIYGKERPSKAKKKRKPKPEMLGTGTASKAGYYLETRKDRIDKILKGIK